MRIVTWNMGCGPKASPYRKRHADAWAYLLDELRPDVLFVQEAMLVNIESSRRDHFVTVCDVAPGTLAGTAVLVRGAARAVPNLEVSADSYAVRSSMTTPAGALGLVAIHVYPGDNQHADLARLVECLKAEAQDTPLLVGGDFNAARRFDAVYGGNKHQTFFDEIASAGFHDAHWGVHGREVQSFWGRQAKEAYQDDHFFVTASWAGRVRSCAVVDNEIVRRLSDHGPIVLELDVSPAP